MKRVLLIEDDETARTALGKLLRKEGFDVSVASDGKEGLERFQNDFPSIVITDLRMPNVDGMEVLRRIKQRARDTEVIVISGHGDYDVAIDALRAGATDYLKKPVNLEDLLLAVERCRERIAKRTARVVKPVVLVIEDMQDAREILCEQMTKEGWTVLAAKDGEEGMRIFREQRIDVVLTDIRLPKKDGMTFLEEVKAGNECEVILMSGHGDEATTIKAMRLGANNFIRKPLDLDHVLISVERAFEKLQLKRANHFRAREVELANQIIAKISGGAVSVNFENLEKEEKAPHNDLRSVKKLFEPLAIACLLVAKDMTIVYSNPEALAVLGRAPKSFGVPELQVLSGATLKQEVAQGIIANVQKVVGVQSVLETIHLGVVSSMVVISVTVPDLVAVLFRTSAEARQHD